MNRDLFNRIKLSRLFSPVAAVTDNTASVSSIVDTLGYESCVFAIATGTLTDADATFSVLIEESNDAALATKNTVAAGDLQVDTLLDIAPAANENAGYDFSDDNEQFKIGYKGSKRYVRITITPAANTGNHFVAGMAILSNARHQPAGVTQTP